METVAQVSIFCRAIISIWRNPLPLPTNVGDLRQNNTTRKPQPLQNEKFLSKWQIVQNSRRLFCARILWPPSPNRQLDPYQIVPTRFARGCSDSPVFVGTVINIEIAFRLNWIAAQPCIFGNFFDLRPLLPRNVLQVAFCHKQTHYGSIGAAHLSRLLLWEHTSKSICSAKVAEYGLYSLV